VHFPRALLNRHTRCLLAGHRSPPEQDSEVNDFKYALRTRRPGAAAHLIEHAPDSVIGPHSQLSRHETRLAHGPVSYPHLQPHIAPWPCSGPTP
jgi:hypothetical protein